MAVYFYDVGDLESGFAGYRVVRNPNLPSTHPNYRQKWFGLSKYTLAEAEQLAYMHDDLWEKETELRLSHRRVQPGGIGRTTKHLSVATNLRVVFKKAKGTKGYGIYISVTAPDGKTTLFSISKGYYHAINKAISLYSLVYDLTPMESKFYRGLFYTPLAMYKYINTTAVVNFPDMKVYEALTKFRLAIEADGNVLEFRK